MKEDGVESEGARARSLGDVKDEGIDERQHDLRFAQTALEHALDGGGAQRALVGLALLEGVELLDSLAVCRVDGRRGIKCLRGLDEEAVDEVSFDAARRESARLEDLL